MADSKQVPATVELLGSRRAVGPLLRCPPFCPLLPPLLLLLAPFFCFLLPFIGLFFCFLLPFFPAFFDPFLNLLFWIFFLLRSGGARPACLSCLDPASSSPCCSSATVRARRRTREKRTRQRELLIMEMLVSATA